MREARGVGVGFRPQLARALLRAPGRVDFLEVVAESCREPRVRREVAALSELWPVVPHGVKLSLGSAEGVDEGRARELGQLARALRAPLVSEHVAFVRAGGREIGHLTELPMTREAVRVVARNVATLRRHLPDVPLLLENVARAFLWDTHEMSEGEFYREVVRATGCELLLDVSNLYANALNEGRDPSEALAEYPLEHARMVHVAGGVFECDFYYDTHAHPVPDAVFELVAGALARRPDAALLLERDAALDDEAAIFEEVGRLRSIERPDARAAAPPGAGALAASPAARAAPPGAPTAASAALAGAQAALARRLTDAGVDPGEGRPLRRARGVLERKRADEALALLPRLGAMVTTARAIELGRIRETPRPAAMAAVADAMRIAEASTALPELAAAAAPDWLCLRARFVAGPAGPRPRTLPWLGRESLGEGRALWAWKGPGPASAVRLRERGAGARVKALRGAGA
ncbi:MAG TPA: DUF692 domain-containing protein [Polyangiaceae bacterium]|nr:DUF692 domain-containing protein [Polyangiaceae bacterium]